MTLLGLLAAIRFPILERIPLFGDAAVSPHGLGIAIGFGLGAVLMVGRARKRGLGHVHVPDISEAVQEMLTRSAIGAIVGARGFYVLTHLSDFQGRWHEVLYAWQGGLTFLGGVTGAVVLAIPFARKRNWRLPMLLDSAAPGIAVGLAIGRLGDLMIGDHIGAPTDFPLAWECTNNFWVRATNSFGTVAPLPYPTSGAAPTAGCFDVAVHHTALYDFGATIIVLLVLLAMERKKWFDGAFIAAWVYVYGALRFTSDFARQDKTWFGLTGSQWALVGAAALVTAWLLRTKPWQRRDWAWDLAFEHPWLQEDYNPDSGQRRVPQSSHVAVGPATSAPDTPMPDTATPELAEPEEPAVTPASGDADLFELDGGDEAVAPPAPGASLWEEQPDADDEAVDRGGDTSATSAEEAPLLVSIDEPAVVEPTIVEPPAAPAAPTPGRGSDGAPQAVDAEPEPEAPSPDAEGDQPVPAWGIGADTAARVTRSSATEPKMASRPRGPKGGSGS